MTIECNNPYPGPESFARGDARPYFGRDQETSDLTSLAVTERLLVFYAPSGAGKTSVLNKRVIPRLEEKLYEVLPTARVSGAASLPAGLRNVYAYNLMLRLAPNDPQPERFAELSLSDFLWHLSTEDGKTYHYDPSDAALRKATPQRDLWPRVLILDQFEEIITAYPTYWSHREDFFRQVDDALSSDIMLRVIMSLRSDYVQDLERYAGLLQHGLRARYQMFLMGTHDAHLAIEGPASACGKTFEAGVAQQLVRNMSQVREPDVDGKIRTVQGEAVEPIQLQVVCYQLWESMKQAPGNKIERKDLQRLARASLAARADSDQLSQREKVELLSAFVDGALGAFYETALEKARESAAAHVDEAFLRNWFSTQLITEGGTRGFMQRGHEDTGGVPEEVVQKLVDNHLLRSDMRGSVRLVELIHDRFVEPIRTANRWWNERRRREQPWVDAAYRWCESGDGPETRNVALLLADLTLETVLHDTAGQHLEPIIAEYLTASKEAQEKRDQAAALETERARVNEAEARAAAEERLSRWMRGLAAVAVIMAISASIALFFYFRQAGTLKGTNDELIRANQTAEAAKSNAEQSAAAEKTAKEEALKANQIALSLMLANQSQDAWSSEDALLLAHAATKAYSSTLLANAALLDALDDSHRLDDGTMTAYVPHEPLDFAADGPWQAVAFSQDGRVLALSDARGGVTLWDNASGEPIGGRLAAHGEYPVYALAFDPTGPRLISATGDRNTPTAARHDLVLWDLADPAAPTQQVLARSRPAIWSAAWRPDGQQVAVANQDGTVELWDLAGSEPINRTLPGKHDDWAFSVAYDRTGSRLASAGKDGVIILWSELASSNPVSQTLTDHTAWINVVAFSPDGTQLASGSDDGTLRLWDLSQDPPSSIELDNHFDLASQVWDLAFSADGTRLAAGWKDNLARVYDLEQPDASPWQLAGHQGEVSRVAFDPAAPQRLVSLGTGDYQPIAWDLSRRSEFASVQPIAMPASATLRAISPNGRWLAVAGDARTALLGDTVGASPVISYSAGMTLTAAALSGDGARIALAGCQATLPADLSAAPGSTKTPDPNQAVTPAGPKLTGCRLDVLSPDGDKITAPTWTISSTQPIVALAFHPQRPDQWAMALESGEVQTSGGFAASAVNLAPQVADVVHLAFNSDGSQLAALGRDGTVVVWNWANRELVSEYSPDDSEQDAQFDAVAFVLDDAWLALAASAPQPQLELRERATWTLVDRFNLDFGRAADLDLDAGGQTLLAASPGGSLVRWPMDQASWLELACARAGRNLSYDAWRNAFPAASLDNPEEALICDEYPLDVSFAEALVSEAGKAIDDCRANSLADGLALLEQASKDERLKLDPTQSAAKMLSKQALEYLRQPLRTNDDRAKACLDLAAGLAAFDPQQAFQAAASLTQAERLLANPQLIDLGPAVDALEGALEGSQQWPDTWLEDEALRLLPEAYYRFCQQGDEAACDRATAFIDLAQPGDAVPGQINAGSGQPLYFQGQRGQAVTIAMNADNNAFDTFLRLEGPAGASISDDDGGPDLNSLIANYLLPVDGIYRVLPTAYGGGGAGGYRVSFDVNVPRDLTLDRAETSTVQQGSLWQFQGEAGQSVALALDSADPLSDPTLRLIGPDLAALRTDYDSGGNRNALILATLPNDGPYFVSAEGLDGSADYTLRLFEPQPLPWDEPQASGGVSNTLWSFEGARAQVIDLQIATTGGAPTPQVKLRNTNGDPVPGGEAFSALGQARIPAYVLPAGDRYIVQVGPGDSLTPYTLTLTSVPAPALVLDQPVTSTSQANPIWTFAGQPGQIVDIALNSARLTYDPRLALLDASGSEIADDDDGGGDLNARIAAFILPAEGQYFVKALPPGSPVSYTLAISTITPEAIQPGEAVTSTLRQDTLWAFDGQASQPLNVTVQSATGDSPTLTLQLETGEALRYSDGDAIAGFFPPQTGRYYLRVGGLDQTTRYTLALEDLQAPTITFGEPVPSNTMTDDLWRFSGQAGQVVTIDMTGWVPGVFDPYLTLLGSDGRTLIERDDISSDNYNARIATFILPQSGDYFIRAGQPGYLNPYTLSLQEVQPPQITFGETQSSNTQAIELWRFSGRAGQVVDVDLSGASDSGFDPYLTVYASDGSILAENNNVSDVSYDARIAALILPQTGDYFIRAGQPGYATPYQLRLTARRAAPIVLGSSQTATQSTAFALPVERPTFAAISVDPQAELTLAAPGGAALASRAPAILTRLDATGVYTLGVSFPADGRPRRVSIAPIVGASRPISVTGTTPGQLRTGNTDLWSLPSVGQAVRVTAVGESFTPLLELWAPGGERLAASDDSGVLTGLLPAAGDALLSLRGSTVQASGPYTLTVESIEAAPGPQACNSSSEAGDYLPVRQGSLVLLGRQRPVNGVDGWIVDMTPYVGRQARVTALAGADWVGCPVVYVDIDQGQHAWRVRDLMVVQ